jgi:hypothetical protein
VTAAMRRTAWMPEASLPLLRAIPELGNPAVLTGACPEAMWSRSAEILDDHRVRRCVGERSLSTDLLVPPRAVEGDDFRVEGLLEQDREGFWSVGQQLRMQALARTNLAPPLADHWHVQVKRPDLILFRYPVIVPPFAAFCGRGTARRTKDRRPLLAHGYLGYERSDRCGRLTEGARP